MNEALAIATFRCGIVGEENSRPRAANFETLVNEIAEHAAEW
jgi:hypothetical protein